MSADRRGAAPDLTRAFLDAVARVPVGPEARAVAADLVRDAIAVACAAGSEPGPAHLLALAGSETGPCHVIGRRRRVAPATAARVNGALIHVLDYEPMWNPANHAVSTALPGLLALAAAEGADDAALLDALVRGIEAQGRLRLASGQFEPRDLLLHPPGVVGPVGAAVAAGHLIGLDPGRMAMAVGIAASRAAGILANVGTMTKALHCGQAAVAGLDSALLARAGFDAHPDALGADRGFLAAYFGAGADPAPLTADMDAPHALHPGPAWKLYPAQYGTHFIIEAALSLHAALLSAGKGAQDVERVGIRCPSMPYVDRPQPVSGLDGKFSMQYVAATALINGRVGLEHFTDAQRFAAPLQALLDRITLTPDPAREGRFDRMVVDLELRTRDGQLLSARCDGPPGIWGRQVPPARLAAKHLDCLTISHGAETAQALIGELAGIGSGRRICALLDRIEELLP